MSTDLRIGEDEFDTIEEIGEWDYSWHIGALLRGQDGALYFAEDSGCSCTYFGMDFTLDDLTPVKSWQEAVELSKQSFSDSDVVSFAERLMKTFM